MTPYFRYAMAALAALVGALSVTCSRAEEAPGVNMVCVTQMAPETVRVTQMHQAGAAPALIEHLIRTDPILRDVGRWILVRTLDALEAGMAPELAVTFLWGLCSLPESEHGGVPDKDAAYLEGGGMFWPILPQHKDI